MGRGNPNREGAILESFKGPLGTVAMILLFAAALGVPLSYQWNELSGLRGVEERLSAWLTRRPAMEIPTIPPEIEGIDVERCLPKGRLEGRTDTELRRIAKETGLELASLQETSPTAWVEAGFDRLGRQRLVLDVWGPYSRLVRFFELLGSSGRLFTVDSFRVRRAFPGVEARIFVSAWGRS